MTGEKSMTITYRRRFINMEETWGDGGVISDNKRDISIQVHLLLEAPQKLISIGNKETTSLDISVPNFLIDLRSDEANIFKKIHKSTRADIRKATENDEITYYGTDHPTGEQIKEFCMFYNLFAEKKGIALCSLERLQELRNHDALIMTVVRDKNSNILCASMLLQDRCCSQLYGLYGVSARLSTNSSKERNKIGRANKFLQWKEIQLAREKGFDWYNFGGEIHQEKDLGVNDFKRRFGAIRGFDRRIYTSRSLLGKMYVYLLYYKWKNIIPSMYRM